LGHTIAATYGWPCIVAATSSGSRGVYGAAPTTGEWALNKGCAAAYNDKGTGVGAHDLDHDRAYAMDGTLVQAGQRTDLTWLRWPTSRWTTPLRLRRILHRAWSLPISRSISRAPPELVIGWKRTSISKNKAAAWRSQFAISLLTGNVSFARALCSLSLGRRRSFKARPAACATILAHRAGITDRKQLPETALGCEPCKSANLFIVIYFFRGRIS
jgi:hypothetical protein